MVEISPVGLGTFPFSNVFSEVSEAEAFGIVETYLASGGSYIETAPIYPVKKIILKELLSNFPREKLVIGSKCALAVVDGKAVRSGKIDFLKRQAEQEIDRLGLGMLDLIQTHITPTDVTPEELGESLAELVNSGLTKSVGCSNISLVDLKRVTTTCRVDWVQVRLSFIHRFEYEEIADFCTANKISLNVFQVIERGQLLPHSGKARREGDIRLTKQEYIGDADRLVRDWYQSLQDRWKWEGYSISALPVAWALSQPAVKCAVVGATRSGQLTSTLRDQKNEITSEILDFVDAEFFQLEAQCKTKYSVSLRALRGVERQV